MTALAAAAQAGDGAVRDAESDLAAVRAERGRCADAAAPHAARPASNAVAGPAAGGDRAAGRLDAARAAAAAVRDPELPMLTLADLGVLREVRVDQDGTATAVLTPTYTGCPALAEMRADLVVALRDAGFADARVETQLSPAWSTDDITAEGRRKLAEAGIAPPGAAPKRPATGPVPLTLGPLNLGRTGGAVVHCPHCGSADTEETSRFGATACKALRRCRACREPFEQVKEI